MICLPGNLQVRNDRYSPRAHNGVKSYCSADRPTVNGVSQVISISPLFSLKKQISGLKVSPFHDGHAPEASLHGGDVSSIRALRSIGGIRRILEMVRATARSTGLGIVGHVTRYRLLPLGSPERTTSTMTIRHPSQGLP